MWIWYTKTTRSGGFRMVRSGRFERPTSSFAGRRSIQLSYDRKRDHGRRVRGCPSESLLTDGRLETRHAARAPRTYRASAKIRPARVFLPFSRVSGAAREYQRNVHRASSGPRPRRTSDGRGSPRDPVPPAGSADAAWPGSSAGYREPACAADGR